MEKEGTKFEINRPMKRFRRLLSLLTLLEIAFHPSRVHSCLFSGSPKTDCEKGSDP